MSVELEWPDGIEQLTFPEFERRVQDGLVPPETPIRFEVITGRQFVPVGELELYEALAHTGIGEFREGLRRLTAPIITAVLLGIQLRIYLFSLSADHQSELIEQFANWSPAVFEQAQIYRLFSYGLVHVNFSHFIINALFLGYLGWNLERGFGHKNFFTVWTAAVFAGGVMSILLTPMRPSIGASAGAFGLLSASVVFGWKHGELIPQKAAKFFGWGVLPYLIFSLSMGFNSSSVDNWGHIGGLLAGGLLATLLEPETFKHATGSNRRIRALTGVSIGLTSILFITSGANFVKLQEHHERGFVSAHPATWERNWTSSGDRGWVSPSFMASIVSRTAQYENTLSVLGAVEAFSGQIEIWGDHVTEIGSREITLGAFTGMEMEFTFTIRDVEQGLRAVVVPRGRYLHMVYVQTDLSQHDKYSDLSRRLFERISITPPPGLSRARAVAALPGSSPLDYLALGVEAGRAGYFLEASQAFRTAMVDGSNNTVTDAALGLMALYIDYEAGVTIEETRNLATRFTMDASIQLAAAEVLIAAGHRDEAAELLVSAWSRGLQKFSVGEALDELGIQVEPSNDFQERPAP